MDSIGECLPLVMRSKHIVLTALAFFNLAISGGVYCDSKESRVYRGEFPIPDGSRGPLGLITLMSEALFSSVNRLGIFEIVRSHVFGAAESRLAFRRSSEIN